MASQAIAIGINQYEFLQPLQYARQDAIAVQTFLKEEARFDRVFYFSDDSPPINGKSTRPTRNNLRRVLREIFAQPFLGDGDDFWFFFSGHGMRDNERDYLMPIDGDPNDIAETGISIQLVTDYLRQSGADNVVLLLDACRSGGRKDGRGIGNNTEQISKQTGVISILSCSPNQYSYEFESLGQGAFTKVLLEGLAMPGGTCATVSRLDDYLQSRVPEVVRQQSPQAQQRPYTIAEPISKAHQILIPRYARPTDAKPLRVDALRAETQGNYALAKRCWMRVLAVCPVDGEAIDSIIRLARLADSGLPMAAPSVASPAPATKGNSTAPSAFQNFVETLAKDVDLEMLAIPAGEFWMGANENEEGASEDEYPRHKVKVPAFYMGRYPVTQAQWTAVAKLPKINTDLNPDPANFKGSDPRGNGEAARPVEFITWFEAVEFCDRLSRKTGKPYRLPSEAEWEYACRAGTTTPFHFGDTLSTDLANYDGNYTYGSGVKGEYRQQTTPVGSFAANAFGLHDMHGNVWECCADHWHENYDRAPTDGSVWEAGGDQSMRLLRGGAWFNNPRYCRSAERLRYTPYLHFNGFGFRVVGCC